MRYRNLEPPYEPHPAGAILKWAVGDKLLGRRRISPPRAVVPKVEPDRALLASGRPSMTWIGHATWLVRVGGRSLLTDPVWSTTLGPGIRRNVDRGLPLEETQTNLVLVTHNHRDHLDAPTIDRIGAGAIYLVPMGLGDFFRRRGFREVIELEWWQSVEVEGVRVHFVPSQHWSRRGLFDQNDSLWGGYVVEAEGRRVYHAGDTAYFSGFAEIGRRFPGIDAALLPIGAYDPEWFMRVQHMSPEDAMQAFVDLGAKRLCAMHWGTFKLTDEPLLEPPERLEAAR